MTSAGQQPEVSASPTKPNVVVFICDDLAWGDLACHGNPHVQTPNLDLLHQRSARLEHYCSGPLCSPARASLMTGRYHLRTRVIDTYCGRSIIDPRERTLAQALGDGGYRCGAFGKWHLGDNYPSRACDMGFHDTVMHNAGGIGQPGDHPENYARWATTSYFDPILHKNGVPSRYEGYCTDIFAEEAMRFISESKEQPFFAFVATNAPHTPLIIDEKWWRKYADKGVDEKHAKIYGMVENIDHNVGRLLGHLDEAGAGDNTIFIFTSDHGPCLSAESESCGTRWNANLRGVKGTLYQGGVKVPFLLHHPGGSTLPQKPIRRVASPIDVMPTVLDYCGISSPEEAPAMDGTSLRGLLDPGSATPEPTENRRIFMHWHRGDVPIPFRNSAVIEDRYKFYTPHEDSAGELYDLIEDPGEQHNLVESDPGRAAEMRRAYSRWLFDMAGTRGIGTFDCQPIHIGSDAENPTLLTTNDWRLISAEGWNTTDLRGCWSVINLRRAEYRARIRFKKTPDAGPFFLSFDDAVLESNTVADDGWVEFPAVELQAGHVRIEGWAESATEDDSLYLRRYQSAFYVELSRCLSLPEHPSQTPGR